VFTGLIEETGLVKSVAKDLNGLKITISCSKILDDVKIDDSIAVNGVCLTVVAFSDSFFTVQAVRETVDMTTHKHLKGGMVVNLERAMRVSDRLGGHIVQGHVDAIGKIVRVVDSQLSRDFYIKFDSKLKKYIVSKGSICLDGISLTIASVDVDVLRVSIIPHTVEATTIAQWRQGSLINMETDILGRYIEKMLGSKDESVFERLQDMGF